MKAQFQGCQSQGFKHESSPKDKAYGWGPDNRFLATGILLKEMMRSSLMRLSSALKDKQHQIPHFIQGYSTRFCNCLYKKSLYRNQSCTYIYTPIYLYSFIRPFLAKHGNNIIYWDTHFVLLNLMQDCKLVKHYYNTYNTFWFYFWDIQTGSPK